MNGFKQFLMRGNVVDLAVAVVIGAAFGNLVAALVRDLITPIIAAVVRTPDFSAVAFQVNGSKFLIGDFINALLSFLLIAATVYFAVVLPVGAMMARLKKQGDPTRKNCADCLSQIPTAARRCAFCTSFVRTE